MNKGRSKMISEYLGAEVYKITLTSGKELELDVRELAELSSANDAEYEEKISDLEKENLFLDEKNGELEEKILKIKVLLSELTLIMDEI